MRHWDPKAQKLVVRGFLTWETWHWFSMLFGFCLQEGNLKVPSILYLLMGLSLIVALCTLEIGNLLSKMYFLGMLTHANSVSSGGWVICSTAEGWRWWAWILSLSVPFGHACSPSLRFFIWGDEISEEIRRNQYNHAWCLLLSVRQVVAFSILLPPQG